MLLRLLTVLFYTVLGVIVLGFIFSNRAEVAITIPFIAEITAPLYVALVLTFALGLLIGLSYAALLSLGAMRRERRQRRAINALEKEVAVQQTTAKLSQ
jgi:uncharacterized integral membrane protein